MCSNVLPLFLGVQLQQEFHLGHSGSQFVLQGSPKLFDEIIRTSFVQVFSMSCAIEEFRGCEEEKVEEKLMRNEGTKLLPFF